MTADLLGAALAYRANGLSVLPASREQKRPLCGKSWREFTTRLPTADELRAWFGHAAVDALAIVTGSVSGGAPGTGLIALDFDRSGKVFQDWFAAIPPALRERLVIESTQHGGRHCFWRSPAALAPSEKLAMDAGGVLVETRCEGAIVLAAPTPGYELQQADFAHIPVLTEAEHEALVAAARKFDERKPSEMPPSFEGPSYAALGGGRPGDVYNRDGLDDFRAMLERHGWVFLGKSGANEAWRRPGKETGSLSATFNGKVLFNFSTNVPQLEGNCGYSPFSAFAFLEHGGDFAAAARDLAAKGYGEPRPVEVVELSDEEVAEVRGEGVRDPGLLPESACHVGGWIEEHMSYTLATSPRPNTRLAFAGALAAACHVASLGRVADDYDTRPNGYFLSLAPSGAGKASPRKVNKALVDAIGEGGSAIDSFGSGPGLEDCFLDRSAILAQVDEVHKLFASLKDPHSALAQGTVATLLQLFSESDQTHIFRRLSQSRPSDRGKRRLSVPAPHLTILATGIAELTFASLSMEALTGGLLARCVLIEAGSRGPAGTPHRAPLPARVLADAMRLRDIGSVVDAGASPVDPAIIVPESDAARKLRAELIEESDRLYDACPDSDEGVADRALFARQVEKMGKLALVMAVSDNMAAPCIDVQHLRRAWVIVSHSTDRMRFLSRRYIFESEFDGLAKRAMRFVTASSKPITRSALLRSLHIDARSFDNLIETLKQAHQIVSVPGARRGAECYKPV